MKNKLFSAFGVFAVIIIAVTLILYRCCKNTDMETLRGDRITALNAIDHAVTEGDSDGASAMIHKMQEELRTDDIKRSGSIGYIVICAISLGAVFSAFCYVYIRIIRPFENMRKFAEQVARGDLDIPLDYSRSDYFGDFTWAFDSMRREILRSRACEREAIDNNKTVIATLSHDIKTPIASIRAYVEGLEANMDSTPERREKYLTVIMKKCDEVSRLTNDLFLHSISDMEKLRVAAETTELRRFFTDIMVEMAGERGDISFTPLYADAWADIDQGRMTQAAENIINNARKYAGTPIDISMAIEEGMAVVTFRDHGQGIPDSDMPFILGKFYRGKNCGEEQGSGLGLYIVKYIMDSHRGNVELRNHSDGLEVRLLIPLKRDI